LNQIYVGAAVRTLPLQFSFPAGSPTPPTFGAQGKLLRLALFRFSGCHDATLYTFALGNCEPFCFALGRVGDRPDEAVTTWTVLRSRHVT
jgi:hypothetical protein